VYRVYDFHNNNNNNNNNMSLTTVSCEIWKFTPKRSWKITSEWTSQLFRNSSYWSSRWSQNDGQNIRMSPVIWQNAALRLVGCCRLV